MADAAIEITSTNGGSISTNGGDGIEINLTNTDLTDLTVDGTLVQSLRISDLTIQGNVCDGIGIHSINSNLGDAVIENNAIIGNAGDGVDVSLSNGGNLAILNNQIQENAGLGIHVTQEANLSNITIDGNTVISNALGNIIVDLSGTATSELHIDNNIVDGDGVVEADVFNTGVNFLGTTLNDTSGVIPPDSMGSVGLNHIVEMINGAFAIYDKSTGNLVSRISLDQFWLSAGLPNVQAGSFDPRIIFDPTTNRWFATSLDAANNPSGIPNNVLVAVSETDDPTGNWSAFRFRGDFESQTFNDFVTLGIDDQAIYLATTNFTITNANFEVSAYSIPKSDLLAANPSITNLNRMEDNFIFQYGGVLQPAIDFNSPDNHVPVLAANDNFGTSLTRSDIFTFGNNSILGNPTTINVPVYFAPNSARQPGAPDVENDASRFSGSVVQVNGSLWAVHAVRGSNNNSAIRWYEIDESTNAVIQTGLIEDANRDFYYPSVAVNDAGVVVIGYSGSGPTQFISSMASFGLTDTNGNTTFNAPQILAAGADNYNVTFGSGRNRWGDYSSTVVDPTDPNKFWTFQERVSALNTWGLQITEIDYQHIDPVNGTTLGDAIAVSLSDSAHLLDPSSINGNTVTGHGGDGIRVNLNDNGAIDNLTIDGNTVTNNAGNGIGFLTTGTPTLGNLSISDSVDVANNGGDGINVQLNNVLGAPNISVDGNNVHDNSGLGIAIDGIDSSVGVVSVQQNIVADNTGGDGLRVNLSSTTGGHVVNRVLANSNEITGNAEDGIQVNLSDLNITTDVIANTNLVTDNAGRGIFINVLNTNINDIVASFNTVTDNTNGDGISVLVENNTGGVRTADQIILQNNTVTGNSGER